MKTKIFTLVLMLAFCVSGFAQDDKCKYYYSYDVKNSLSVVQDKFIISAEESAKSSISDYLSSINAKIKWIKSEVATAIFEVNVPLESIIDALSDKEDVKSIQPVYVCVDDYDKRITLEVGITDQFVVKFIEDASREQIEDLYAKYDVSVLNENDNYTKLSVSRNSDALDIANAFQESGLVIFSHPDFISSIEVSNGLGQTNIDNIEDSRKSFVYMGNLYLNLPANEKVSLYSISGTLLYSGYASHSLSLDGIQSKVLVVRSSSGWAEKVINNK
ncbi:MAG: hypothetical protein LBJ17_08840 [Dysgonamonadaceae bacterium]|jgi:hypothetical protein|nr:hypothetical protein [Dysgonamonadaceae bacterium]